MKRHWARFKVEAARAIWSLELANQNRVCRILIALPSHDEGYFAVNRCCAYLDDYHRLPNWVLYSIRQFRPLILWPKWNKCG